MLCESQLKKCNTKFQRDQIRVYSACVSLLNTGFLVCTFCRSISPIIQDIFGGIEFVRRFHLVFLLNPVFL